MVLFALPRSASVPERVGLRRPASAVASPDGRLASTIPLPPHLELLALPRTSQSRSATRVSDRSVGAFRHPPPQQQQQPYPSSPSPTLPPWGLHMTFSDWLETQKIAAHQGAPASAAAADAAVGWRPTTGQRRSLPNAPLVDWPVLQSSCQLLPTARRLVSAAEEDALMRNALVQSGAASAAGPEAKAAAWRGWLRADREAVEERDRAKARRAGSAVERLLASPHWAALSSGAAPGSGTTGLFEHASMAPPSIPAPIIPTFIVCPRRWMPFLVAVLMYGMDSDSISHPSPCWRHEEANLVFHNRPMCPRPL